MPSMRHSEFTNRELHFFADDSPRFFKTSHFRVENPSYSYIHDGCVNGIFTKPPLSQEEKCAVAVPEFIVLPPFQILPEKPNVPSFSDWILVMNKPLYGSRLAPIRRWIRICERFRTMDFRQRRLDVYMFMYRSPLNDAIGAIVTTHVDDFLATATEAGLSRFQEAMSVFVVGGLLELSLSSPLVYFGINVSLHSSESIGLSQTDFISRMGDLEL